MSLCAGLFLPRTLSRPKAVSKRQRGEAFVECAILKIHSYLFCNLQYFVMAFSLSRKQKLKGMVPDNRYREIKILIASPGDVMAERDCAELVIRRLEIYDDNQVLLRLIPKRWEFDAASEMGNPAQDIINRQLVDGCDCAVCMFWTRIGTSTDVAPGGAVEELERMVAAGKLVMLYFSDASLPPPSAFDLDQYSRLHAWKKTLVDEKRGLVKTYENIDKFEIMLQRELEQQLLARFGCGKEGVCKVDDSNTTAELLQRYQSTLKRQLGNITLTGSPALESFSVKLSETFVSLSLSGSLRCGERSSAGGELCDEAEYRRSSTPEEVMSFVFKEHPLLLVIGDPGSGKTTLLKYFALSCLDSKRHKDFGFGEPVTVFFLPLRDFSKGDTGYPSLQATLSTWAQKYFLDIPEELFSAWLDKPSTLVLLDGLDEISDVNDRIALCKWVDRTVGRFTKARFVVTSRSTGYRKGDGIELEASHLRADIMDFSEKQQAEFLHRWFKAAFLGEIPPGSGVHAVWRSEQEQKALKKADAILAFIGQEKNRSLRPLAGVPLLLQIMAMLWKEREYLPASRLKLYDAALNYMLDYRDRRRGIDPLLVAEDARRVLSPVSLWMQEDLKKDEADRTELQQQMQVQLNTLYNSLPASEFCRNLVDRAGVLVEYGDREYVFRHKSFREYLAGVQLLKNMHRSGSLDVLVSHFGDDWWTEVFRFFIGHVEDAELFDSFMERLFDSPVTEELTQKQQDLLVTLVEEAPQRKIDALQKKLLDTATTPNRQRYILECLKTIGKPEALEVAKRFTESSRKNVVFDKLNAEYILIKGGTFTYSVTGNSETVDDLYVAKYTVTNQLYRRFISYLEGKEAVLAEALPVESYQTVLEEEAVKIDGFSNYLNGENDLAKRFRSDSDDDKRFNKDDQPVMDIRWYAAKAYCLWLSLLENDGRDINLYRLPEEKEWEYAAGGKESRTYPWGEKEPSKSLANYNEHEGATTPVGRYPDGATPEGLYDMAGNVWEWMDNWYDEEKKYRALRGGSWGSYSDLLRCSARNYYGPESRNLSFGFRVVRSSPSS